MSPRRSASEGDQQCTKTILTQLKILVSVVRFRPEPPIQEMPGSIASGRPILTQIEHDRAWAGYAAELHLVLPRRLP